MTARRITTARRWTSLEHRFLERNYGIMKRAEIAETLGRSLESVENHARQQGISAIENRKAAGLFGPPRSRDRHLSPAKHAQACLKRYHEHKHDPEYAARIKAAQDRYRAKVKAQPGPLVSGMKRTGTTPEKRALRGYFPHLEIGQETAA